MEALDQFWGVPFYFSFGVQFPKTNISVLANQPTVPNDTCYLQLFVLVLLPIMHKVNGMSLSQEILHKKNLSNCFLAVTLGNDSLFTPSLCYLADEYCAVRNKVFIDLQILKYLQGIFLNCFRHFSPRVLGALHKP